MKENEILEEIHRFREEHARACDYDIHKMFEEDREAIKKLKAEGWKVVSLDPRERAESSSVLREEPPQTRRFVKGQCYSRNQIAAELGGGEREFLPHVDGRVVCACVRKDYNADAPQVILAGTDPGVQRWAAVLCEQRGPIPVFVKQQPNAWEYVGDFEVERCSQSPNDIAEHEARSGRGGEFPVSRVIYMREVVAFNS